MVYHNYMLRENIKKKKNARDTYFLQKIYKLLVCGESLLVNKKVMLIVSLDENQ